MNPAEAIEAAELAERETTYRNQLARQMYEAGRRDGAAYEQGRRDESADRDRRWNQIARPAAHAVSNAELEERRYGPGGREHFADHRPGDFPGRHAAALQQEVDTDQQEVETEREAGG